MSHQGYKHHASFDDVKRAAEAGCRLCVLLTTYCAEYKGGAIDLETLVVIGIDWQDFNRLYARPIPGYTLVIMGFDYTSSEFRILSQ